MTSSLPPTTPTTSQQPYWLPWGSWICENQSGACFQKRKRNCSTGIDYDCEQSQGGKQYNVGLCTVKSCPGEKLFTLLCYIITGNVIIHDKIVVQFCNL
jgi:hypothetical protein